MELTKVAAVKCLISKSGQSLAPKGYKHLLAGKGKILINDIFRINSSDQMYLNVK